MELMGYSNKYYKANIMRCWYGDDQWQILDTNIFCGSIIKILIKNKFGQEFNCSTKCPIYQEFKSNPFVSQ